LLLRARPSGAGCAVRARDARGVRHEESDPAAQRTEALLWLFLSACFESADRVETA